MKNNTLSSNNNNDNKEKKDSETKKLADKIGPVRNDRNRNEHSKGINKERDTNPEDTKKGYSKKR
jgi:hypothetical protein